MSQKKTKAIKKVIARAIAQKIIPDRQSVTRRLFREMKRRRIWSWPDVK